MVNRLVSVGDDFTLPPTVKVEDANLPANLQPAALSATYAPVTGSTAYATPAAVTAAVAPKLDTTAAATTYVKFVDLAGNPISARHVTIKVDTTTWEINDIIAEA